MADETGTSQEPLAEYDWDFFLAHAGPDLQVARMLKRELEPPAKAFLDDDNLVPGDTFDSMLAEAQQSSLISVVIVSPNTQNAYYQREEIAAAIQMAREDPHTHRVVPVFLNKKLSSRQIPYGLRIRHGLEVPETGELSQAAQDLLKTLAVMKKYEGKKVIEVEKQQTAIKQIAGGANVEVLSGLNQATKFVRPLLVTLLVLFVLIAGLLVASLLFPGLGHDERVLAATVLGGLCAAILASILALVTLSLTYAQRIAAGRINGG